MITALKTREVADGVFDMMVPLDKEGYYTIVVSLPEDRPKNATAENGVTWINWGPGEGLNDPRNRKDWGMKWNMVLAGGGLAASDEITLTIDLELTKPVEAVATTQAGEASA